VSAVARAAGLLGVTLAGIMIGLLVGGPISADLGPFHTRLSVSPSFNGGTDVAIPPLGSLHLRSHDGPAHLQVRLDSIDEARARAVVSTPNGLSQASDGIVADLSNGVVRLILRVLGLGLLGTLLLAALVYRSVPRVAACGVLALAVLGATGAV
jgi:hypothetical protein